MMSSVGFGGKSTFVLEIWGFDCLNLLRIMMHFQIEVFRWYRSNIQLDEIQRMKSENVLQDVPEK